MENNKDTSLPHTITVDASQLRDPHQDAADRDGSGCSIKSILAARGRHGDR